jgi:hypothetical protein
MVLPHPDKKSNGYKKRFSGNYRGQGKGAVSKGRSRKDGKRQKSHKTKKAEQLGSRQLDEIVSQGEQAEFSAYFFQTSEHKSAEISIVFDMTENTFHLPAAARPQFDPFIGSQKLPGSLFQSPVVPTDIDLAITLAPGALGFERTIAAIETGITAFSNRPPSFGFPDDPLLKNRGRSLGQVKRLSSGPWRNLAFSSSIFSFNRWLSISASSPISGKS